MTSTKLEPFFGGDFAEYLERLEFYFVANDIGVVPSEAIRAQTATTAKKKIAHLISCLSKDIYATLKSLCLPDSPADRTYKEITDLLKEFFQVQTSATTASFTFLAWEVDRAAR